MPNQTAAQKHRRCRRRHLAKWKLELCRRRCASLDYKIVFRTSTRRRTDRVAETEREGEIASVRFWRKLRKRASVDFTSMQADGGGGSSGRGIASHRRLLAAKVRWRRVYACAGGRAYYFPKIAYTHTLMVFGVCAQTKQRQSYIMDFTR